jgi:hypothetical protein
MKSQELAEPRIEDGARSTARMCAQMGKVERDVEGVVVGCHRTEVIN